MQDRSIALTGATGFIGGAIASALVHEGYRVRVLIRPGSVRKPLPSNVERIVGSLEDPVSLQQLARGVDTLVHCAGAVRGADEARFMRTNSEAVERLVRCAVQQSCVQRFLLISSLAASKPSVSPYAASKRGGENALASVASGMICMALRPPAVYGPGDRELLPLFTAMARGFAPLWGGSDTRFSLIFIDDLVAAVVQWVASAKPVSGVFELHDGRSDGYSMSDVIDIAAEVFNRRIRTIRIPAPVLKIATAVNTRLARVAGYEPMLTPWKLNELREPRWVCDNGAFTAATQWQPRIALAAGLPLTLRGDPKED